MNAEDWVGLAIPVTWLAMVAVEAAGTGRAWPAERLWRTRGVAFFVMVMTLNALLPALLQPWLAGRSLLDLQRWPLAAQCVTGFAALTLANALLHRAYHRYDPLWRWVHQLHHAPRRVDAWGAIMFTPWEVVLNIAAFQTVVVLLLGLDPLAAALVGYVAVFYGLFQHFNVNTPQWLGYLIQRPESHGVHHRRGHHGFNYSDLPLWDILWGTFRNPRHFRGDTGFDGDGGTRIAPLLLGRDANAALYGRANLGRPATERNPA